jgi:hypothetical protein
MNILDEQIRQFILKSFNHEFGKPRPEADRSRRGLASISTVLEMANAPGPLAWFYAKRITSFLFPYHGMGVDASASPDATR